MHLRSWMGVAQTSLLRHKVETLDISNEIFAVQWMEHESQLHDGVVYHIYLNSALSTIAAWYAYLWYRSVASCYLSLDSWWQYCRCHEGGQQWVGMLSKFAVHQLVCFCDTGTVEVRPCTRSEFDQTEGDNGRLWSWCLRCHEHPCSLGCIEKTPKLRDGDLKCQKYWQLYWWSFEEKACLQYGRRWWKAQKCDTVSGHWGPDHAKWHRQGWNSWR